ncbi:MAG: hypothetical protein EOP73_30210, partial [Variovorax sp.]
MTELHYYPSNASFAPHILLEEIGAPFSLRLVDRSNNEHKSAAYLQLNPNGLIPTLVDGDLVLYETAAILMHLADRHPGFAPAPGCRQDRDALPQGIRCHRRRRRPCRDRGRAGR